jgi:ketosteroid isomerase-like protein
MKKWIWLLLLGLCVAAFAQDTLRADANSAAEDECKKLEADLAQMIVKGEWDQYAAHLMDDFEHTNGNGVAENKSVVMERLRSGAEKILDLAPEDLKVRVYGDTAIVTGHFTLVQRRNGRVDTFFARETEVFLKRNGHWMLAEEHATSVTR